MLRIAHRLPSALVVFAFVASACGGAEPSFSDDAFARAASSDIGVGTGRLLVGVSEGTTTVGSPDEPVTFEVGHVDNLEASQRVAATFSWILEPVIGLYRAEVEFDRPGSWQVILIPESGPPLEPVLFNVFAEPRAPAVGAVAPAPSTPTLDELPLEELTTDSSPDLRFYQTSIADAVASGIPTVVVFSTPAYCLTSACGPLLETVKMVAPDYPDMNFVHVEVFTGLTEPDFAPDGAHLAPAVTAEWYNLLSEPWVFVVDGAGIVSARFEGVMEQSELRDALAKISL